MDFVEDFGVASMARSMPVLTPAIVTRDSGSTMGFGMVRDV